MEMDLAKMIREGLQTMDPRKISLARVWASDHRIQIADVLDQKLQYFIEKAQTVGQIQAAGYQDIQKLANMSDWDLAVLC